MKKHLTLSKINDLTRRDGAESLFSKSKYASKVKTCILAYALITDCATIAHAAEYTGTCGATATDCHYVQNTTDSTLTITGAGAMTSSIPPPWYIHRATIKNVSISGVTTICNDAFAECTGLTSVTIPSSVNTIGTGAFAECTGLTSVTIPSSVNTIGNYVFQNCTGLTSVTIPSSVNIIGRDAFSECTGLTSVTISSGNIDNYAFYNCTGLTSVTISSGVNNIGNYAFRNCTGLTSVFNYAESPQTINTTTFQSVNRGNIDLYIPAGTQAAYTAAGWTGFKSVSDNIVLVRGVSLGSSSLYIAVNDTRRLTAIITPPNATNQNIEWSSSNPAVASVSSSGLVTAMAEGTATIKVRTEDGGFRDSCRVTVTPFIHVTGLSMSKTRITVPVGGSAKLSVTVAPSNATNKNVRWSSNKKKIATVNNTGEVKTLTSGTAIISAISEDGSKVAQCVVISGSGSTAVAVESLPQLMVRPNPVGDELRITEEFDGVVEIYDVYGTLVMTSATNVVNVSSLKAGIYIVKAGMKAAKMVKQ